MRRPSFIAAKGFGPENPGFTHHCSGARDHRFGHVPKNKVQNALLVLWEKLNNRSQSEWSILEYRQVYLGLRRRLGMLKMDGWFSMLGIAEAF